MHLCKLCALSKRQMINFEWRWKQKWRIAERQRRVRQSRCASNMAMSSKKRRPNAKLFKLASRNNEQRQLAVACDTNNSFSILKPFCVLIHSMIPMEMFFPRAHDEQLAESWIVRRREFGNFYRWQFFNKHELSREKKLSTVDDFYKLYFIILIPIACVGAVCFQ